MANEDQTVDDDREGRGLGVSGMDIKEIGDRLRLTRIATRPELTQSAYAHWLEIGVTAYNNYEKGIRPIGVEEAIKVAMKTRTSLDWIFQGVDVFLPLELRRTIDALRLDANNAPSERKRRRPA